MEGRRDGIFVGDNVGEVGLSDGVAVGTGGASLQENGKVPSPLLSHISFTEQSSSLLHSQVELKQLLDAH